MQEAKASRLGQAQAHAQGQGKKERQRQRNGTADGMKKKGGVSVHMQDGSGRDTTKSLGSRPERTRSAEFAKWRVLGCLCVSAA